MSNPRPGDAMDDLEDSDAEEVALVQTPQRRRARLRMSMDSRRVAAELVAAGSEDNQVAEDAASESDGNAGDSDKARPSRAAGRRPRSMRETAAKASKRLSLVAAELEDHSGGDAERAAAGDSDAGGHKAASSSQLDEGLSDEQSDGQSDKEPAQPAAPRSGRQAASQSAAPSRPRSSRRSSNAAADRIAAAGETFRQRRAARKPAPDAAAAAEARRQSIQVQEWFSSMLGTRKRWPDRRW